MILKTVETGKHLGKFEFPNKYTGRVQKSIEFEYTGEQIDSVLALTAICIFCIEGINDNFKFRVSCTSTYELEIKDKLTVDDLLPIWKKGIKNLRDLFYIEEVRNRVTPTDIPYPPNDVIKADIAKFLIELDWQ